MEGEPSGRCCQVVHRCIVRFGRQLLNDLPVEGHAAADGMGVVEEAVVIAFAAPQTSPKNVEGYRRDEEQVQLVKRNDGTGGRGFEKSVVAGEEVA